MKLFGIIFLFLGSCATPQAKHSQVDVHAYFQPDLTTAAAITNKFGKPSEVETDIIAGKKLEFWSYIAKNGSSIEFLIDTAEQTVLEKRFLAGKDQGINVDELKSSHLRNIDLQKIAVKCRHYDEIALVNQQAGIVILTRDSGRPLKVQVIAQSSPQLYEYWLSENSKKKCSY